LKLNWIFLKIEIPWCDIKILKINQNAWILTQYLF